MPAISALDTISPAIKRTRDFLFRPFRLSTFLKLCLVAVITEGFSSSFNINFPMSGGHSSHQTHFANTFPTLKPWLIPAIAGGVLLALVLGFLLLYLITRLRFAYFYCLIHNIREIRPGWRLYRAQAIRFFWLNVVVGLCFLLLVAIISVPFAAGFWRLFHSTPASGQPDTGMLLTLILPLFPIAFLLVLAFFATDIILRDFMLPHFALENATSGQAWTAAWTRIKSDKTAFFVYALLRLILPFAAIIGLIIALIIPGIIVTAAFVFIELGIHSAFAGAPMLGLVLQVLVGIVAFCVALFVWLCVGGPLSTAVREYALLFYGTRYDRLGGILFPPPEAPLISPGPA